MRTSALKGFTLKEWFWAARPKTLPTAIIPFLAGTMLAFAMGASIQWDLMLFAWLSAICIQVGTNFTNDAYDFKRGTDSSTVLGPKRATRAGMLAGRLSFEQVRNAGLLFFVMALAWGIPLIAHGGWVVALILTISVAAGFAYTGGPFPLAYHGLGDLFVMLFYGFVATEAGYWLQSGSLGGYSFLLSVQVGSLCTSMIAINNLRDVHDDVKTDKLTLPVRFGVRFGRWEITIMVILPLILNLLWPWPWVQRLPWLVLPLSLRIIRLVWTHEPSEVYNEILALSGVHMLAFCSLQAVGFAFS